MASTTTGGTIHMLTKHRSTEQVQTAKGLTVTKTTGMACTWAAFGRTDVSTTSDKGSQVITVRAAGVEVWRGPARSHMDAVSLAAESIGGTA